MADTLTQVPLTLTTSYAGLAAGTTTTYTTANAVNYAIGGIAYTKAAATNAATPTTDATTGAAFLPVTANQGSVFVFGYDAAGNLKVSQGQVQALDAQGNFNLSPQFPSIPDNVAPFGYLVLKAGATLSGSWTFGSSNLSSVTGATYSFKNLMTMPARPVVS
jgi:hypothetical protein